MMLPVVFVFDILYCSLPISFSSAMESCEGAAYSAASKLLSVLLPNFSATGAAFSSHLSSFSLLVLLCSFSILSAPAMCFLVAVGMAELTGKEQFGAQVSRVAKKKRGMCAQRWQIRQIKYQSPYRVY